MNKFAIFLRESVLARFLIPVGLFLIIFGVVVLVINIKNQNYKEIEATISNVILSEDEYIDADGNHIDATYDIEVKYNINGNEYEAKLNGMSKYNIGEKIKIFYNPSNPNEITQTKSLILPIAIVVGGLIAFIGGIINGMKTYKKLKKMKEQEKGGANE